VSFYVISFGEDEMLSAEVFTQRYLCWTGEKEILPPEQVAWPIAGEQPRTSSPTTGAGTAHFIFLPT
jgi:hypothetical protein